MRILRFLGLIALLAFVILPGTLPRAFEMNLWFLLFAKVVAGLREPRLPVLEGLVDDLPSGHWRPRVVLARAAVRAGAPNEALKLLASEANLSHPWIQKAQAEALAAVGNWHGALAEWEKAKDIKALQLAGKEAFSDGRDEEGLAARQAWFRLDPIGAALPLAKAIWQVEGDAARASELLENTLAEHHEVAVSTRLNWLYTLGKFHRLTKDWVRAEAAYHCMEELKPGDFRSYLGRGWIVYERDGDVEGALAWFEEAKRQAPDRGDPWASGTRILSREKLYAEAESWYAEAISRNPQNRSWYLARANIVRAAGEIYRALALYREALELFPDFPNVYYELAWAYSLAGCHEKALEAVTEAVNLDGGRNVNFLVRAGRIAKRASHLSEAEAWFGRALKRCPNHPTAHALLARMRTISE